MLSDHDNDASNVYVNDFILRQFDSQEMERAKDVVLAFVGLIALCSSAVIESTEPKLVTKLTSLNGANSKDLEPSASDRTFHIGREYGQTGGYPYGNYPGIGVGTGYRGVGLSPGYRGFQLGASGGVIGGGLTGYGYYGSPGYPNYGGYGGGYGGYGSTYGGYGSGYGGYGTGYGGYGSGYGGYGGYGLGYDDGRFGYGRYGGYGLDNYGGYGSYGSYGLRGSYDPYNYRGGSYGSYGYPSGYRGYS